MAQSLRIVGGPGAGTEIPVTQELLIGRSADGEGRLGDDPKLSRQHARIVPDGEGRLRIEDLGSTNGTWVNGQRVSAATVDAGDRVQLGSSTLDVVPGRDPTPAPAAAPPAPGAAPPPPAAAPPLPAAAPPPALPRTEPLAPAGPPQAFGPPQGTQPPQYAGYGHAGTQPAPAESGTKTALKVLAVLLGAVMVLSGIGAGVLAVEILGADEIDTIGDELVRITSTDKLITALFLVPSALCALATLPVAIYYAATGKRGRLVVWLTVASLVLAFIFGGVLAATES